MREMQFRRLPLRSRNGTETGCPFYFDAITGAAAVAADSVVCHEQTLRLKVLFRVANAALGAVKRKMSWASGQFTKMTLRWKVWPRVW